MNNSATTKPENNADNPARHIETHRLTWNGIAIEITWEPCWLNLTRHGREDLAHLEVQSVNPLDAPLPITRTGYRSSFPNTDAVTRNGGPVAYVKAWLDVESQLAQWRNAEAASRQLGLF